MSFFRSASRAYLLNRLLRSQQRRRRSAWGGVYGRSPYGRYPARRRSSGFGMWGPLPTYSRRGRRSNVTVTGCCLPIPLGIFTVGALGLARAVRTR